MPNKLKIAIVSPASPFDRRTWSGTTYFMAQALEKHVGNVEYIGPWTLPGERWKKIKDRFHYRLTGEHHYYRRTLGASKWLGEQIATKLSRKKFDLIFAPAASIEIAHLKTSLPIVYSSDATFSLVQESYGIFKSLSADSKSMEEILEKKALENSSLLIYPSKWAAHSAIEDYCMPVDKVRVIPFGANLDEFCFPREISRRTFNQGIHMLFLGKDWERKGGRVALEALDCLHARGVKAHLTVCGVTPPFKKAQTDVKVIPYIDKNHPDGFARLKSTIEDSHLLILPTQAECYGIVFCEVAAFGLPSFTTRTGGIPSIIEDDVNGYLFPPDAGGEHYAKVIAQLMNDPEKYHSLCREARNRFETVLNWDRWGLETRRSIAEVLNV